MRCDIPKRQRLRLKFNTYATSCACWFVTTVAESIPQPFKEIAIRTGAFAECGSAQTISAHDSEYGAGQVQEQKYVSRFCLKSLSGSPWMTASACIRNESLPTCE